MLAETIKLCEETPDFPYIACAREEECIGVACGAAMAGERAIVMVQNAGMLNSLGAFATMGLRYGLPFVVIVTNRGALADPNGYDIEKREAVKADLSANDVGTGRELFQMFRRNAGRADQGASIFEVA